MKESQFIGILMPSHPDFQPMIQEIREKYQLSPSAVENRKRLFGVAFGFYDNF